MACLGVVNYDPTTAVAKSTAAATAMTAFDTTNARLTFTAPTNGKVLVRIRCPGKGATSNAIILFGVLDGSTVRGRSMAIGGKQAGSAILQQHEAVFLVTGLTGGNSYTFDAAYGVEFGVASTNLNYGGPNDATSSNASGALTFEVWDTANLLAGVNYDPATAAGPSVASLAAMAAVDTTNLRLTFTAPASGKVLARLRTVFGGAATYPNVLLGVLDGSTVRLRQAGLGGLLNSGTIAATDLHVHEAQGVISGLTPGNSYTFDAAYGVEGAIASQVMRYGGPDNATASDAYGGFAFEIWTA
jgi:hypothetical protein